MIPVMKTLSCLLLLASAAMAETVAAGATQPQLAQDPDGTFYCTFLRGGNIEVSVSSDGGATWSAPVVAIDAKGNAKGGMQRGPRIGVDAKKNVYVTAPICFDAAKLKEKYPKCELWLAISSDGGKTFAPPVRVNEVENSAAESLHQLAVSPAGDAHIVWNDERDGKGQCLYYAKVSGGKVAKNMKITPPVCPCCAPGIGLDGKGNPFVAFRTMSDDSSREILLTISRDGGKSWSAPARVNKRETKINTCPMDAPAVAVGEDGKKFAVAWMGQPEGKEKDAFWTMMGQADVPLGTTTKGAQGHVSVGADAAGIFHAAWEDARSGKTAIYRISSAPGAKEELVAEDATYPSLCAGKSVGVAFEKGGNAEFRKLK
jgi:hypothetical protein